MHLRKSSHCPVAAREQSRSWCTWSGYSLRPLVMPLRPHRRPLQSPAVWTARLTYSWVSRTMGIDTPRPSRLSGIVEPHWGGTNLWLFLYRKGADVGDMKGLRFDDGRVGSKWEEDDSRRDEILVHVTVAQMQSNLRSSFTSTAAPIDTLLFHSSPIALLLVLWHLPLRLLRQSKRHSPHAGVFQA